MIQVSQDLANALASPANEPVDLYELYLDSGTVYLSDQDVVWNGHTYIAKVSSRSEIKRYMDGQFDDVSVTFSNVDTSMAELLLSNDIEGRRLVIRKVDRSVPTDSLVLFDGPMDRPAKINDTEAVVSAKHILGSIDFDAPARTFSDFCPWDLGGIECGYSGPTTTCDKSWARCSALSNTARYGGFRFIPHSGTYQYTEVEQTRFLLLFSRKKEKRITAAFNSVDDTPYDVPVPIVYGRVQITGIDIQHEDQGGVTKALVAFCIGKVREILYIRANQAAVTDFTRHYGAFGGAIDQQTDPRFPNSYPYNLVAYVGISIPSDVKVVDPAPTVSAVIMGRDVAIFDQNGQFLRSDWTDNPVWITRDFLTLPLAQGGMGIPESMIDDAENWKTAAYADEIIQDTTGDQQIFNPVDPVPEDWDYRRYKSTGVDGEDPTAAAVGDDYVPGVNDDTGVVVPVPVKRFTANVALAKQEAAVDILFKKLLPSFRGYLTQSASGKLQIRCERPEKSSTVSTAAAAGAISLDCSTPTQWAVGDLAIVSPLTDVAEVIQIAGAGPGSVTVSAPTAFAHAAGEQLLHVAMAFDDSNVIGSLEYPQSDKQPSTNRITLKYTDAPAGFEARELHVNDYEHQAKVHKVNNEDVDGGAIDSYFQAWRIGEWLRAKRRDLGRFVSLTADIKASLLEVGDVIAVSGQEVGLQAVPFMVTEVGFQENDEVNLLGQIYSLDAYSDTAPRCTVTVPTVFGKVASSGSAPEAPNVTGFTAVVSYPTGTDSFVISGTLQMPASTAHLQRLHIVLVDSGGKDRWEQILYGPFTASTTIPWASDEMPRPGVGTSYTPQARSENEDGLITRPAVSGSVLAVAPGAGTSTYTPPSPPSPPTAVSGFEVTAAGVPVRKLDFRDQTTQTEFGATVTLAPGNSAEWVRGWFSTTGTAWEELGDFAVGTEIRWWRTAPIAASTWYCKFTTGNSAGGNNSPATALVSAFSVAGYSKPRADGVSAASADAAINILDGQGVQNWAVPSVDIACPTNDPHAYVVKLTFQATDAAGNPAPEDQGGNEVEVDEWANDGGVHSTNKINSWGYQPEGSIYHYGRLRVYVGRRTAPGESTSFSDTTTHTLQTTCWPGGHAFLLFDFGSMPDGKLRADHLDPTTYGSNLGLNAQKRLDALNSLGANLLSNSGFEQGTLGWRLSGSGGAQFIASPNQNHAPSGSYSLSVQPVVAGGSAQADQVLPATPERTYSFHGWMYAEAGNQITFQMVAWFYDSAGEIIPGNGVQVVDGMNPPLPTGWSYRGGQALAPPGAATAIFGVQAYCNGAGGGTVYWDDLSVYMLPSVSGGTFIDPASGDIITGVGDDPTNALVNGNFTRGVPDQRPGSAVGWLLDADAWITAPEHLTPPYSLAIAGLTNTYARQATKKNVRPGELNYVEVWWSSWGNANGSISVTLDYFDADDGYIATGEIATATAASIAGVWTRQPLQCSVPNDLRIAKAQFRINAITSTPGSYYLVDNCLLRPQISAGPGTQPDGKGGLAVKPGSGVEVGADGGINVRVGGGTMIDANNTVVVKQSYTIKVDASGALSLVGLPRVPGLPALPSASYPAGAVVLNTLDGKVYRTLTGAAGTWSCSNDPSDLVAGALASGVTINASQVNAGTFNRFTFLGCTMTLDLNGITTSINNVYDSAKDRYVGVKISENVVPPTGPLLNYSTHFARGYNLYAKTYSYGPVTQEVMALVSMNDTAALDSYGYFYLGCARGANSIVMCPNANANVGTTIQIDGQTVLKSRRPAVGQVTGTPSGTYGIVEQNILTNLELKYNYLMTNVLGRNGHGLTAD